MIDIVELGAKAFAEDSGLVWDDRSDGMKEICRKRVRAIYFELSQEGYSITKIDGAPFSQMPNGTIQQINEAWFAYPISLMDILGPFDTQKEALEALGRD